MNATQMIRYISSSCPGVGDVYDAYADIRGHGRVISFLPLSEQFTPLAEGGIEDVAVQAPPPPPQKEISMIHVEASHV